MCSQVSHYTSPSGSKPPSSGEASLKSTTKSRLPVVLRRENNLNCPPTTTHLSKSHPPVNVTPHFNTVHYVSLVVFREGFSLFTSRCSAPRVEGEKMIDGERYSSGSKEFHSPVAQLVERLFGEPPSFNLAQGRK
uniref:(northern house mosquito) hypothetical protein n=1 Tax=Culex pipiens TaxID=7175 RepID=A0A8D8FX81_CULPI